ncbi:hypothetical protein ACFFV7_00810 [Nonomuraea spiralis]|uniref:Secreted protein n=1 Tax=Nonomuraea spiralis TaxID=46182 RepID=A0ABV5I708_9ACTN|nr:hypothetical protein [Nonomuraea spiralis]GGS63120.1 hypothetical protein GCM10010176_001610 [Nonomuraea spiralis]
MPKLRARFAALVVAILATLSVVTPAASAADSGEWKTYGPYSFVFDLQSRTCMVSISGGATYEGSCAASGTRGRWHVRYNTVTHLVALHNVAYDTCLNVDSNFKVTTGGCSSVWTQGFNEEKISSGTSQHSGRYMYHPLADASKCLVRGWRIGSCSDTGAVYYQYYNAP